MTKWKTVLAFSSIFLAVLLSQTSAQAPGETASGEMPIAGLSVSISSVPDDISDFPLIPGQDNTAQGTLSILTVGLLGGWSVSVSDENDTTLGKMTEYNTISGEYVENPDKLQACMGVTATDDIGYSTNPCVTLDDGGEIASGLIAYIGTIPITFNQTVSWSDPVSETDRGYKIVVTFSIAAT